MHSTSLFLLSLALHLEFWSANQHLGASFLKIISVASTGGTVTNYSPRFTISGMTGAFPPDVVTALGKLKSTDTTGPDTQKALAGAAAPAPGEGDFDVPYTMQTGMVRFAPMQPIPPTKITKKNAEPQHPTSGYTVATTFLPIPQIQTTITQSQTFSVSSRVNTVSKFFLDAMPTLGVSLSRLIPRLSRIYHLRFRLIPIQGRCTSNAIRRYGQVPEQVERLSYAVVSNIYVFGLSGVKAFQKAQALYGNAEIIWLECC